jgi:hypothetical protein
MFRAFEELSGRLLAGDVPTFRIDHAVCGIKDSGIGREGCGTRSRKMTEPKPGNESALRTNR